VVQEVNTFAQRELFPIHSDRLKSAYCQRLPMLGDQNKGMQLIVPLLECRIRLRPPVPPWIAKND
jgi:hypothetical protein